VNKLYFAHVIKNICLFILIGFCVYYTDNLWSLFGLIFMTEWRSSKDAD